MTALQSVYFPDHADCPLPHGIKPGNYTVNQICQLLRDNADNPQAIHFIADMMEV